MAMLPVAMSGHTAYSKGWQQLHEINRDGASLALGPLCNSTTTRMKVNTTTAFTAITALDSN